MIQSLVNSDSTHVIPLCAKATWDPNPFVVIGTGRLTQSVDLNQQLSDPMDIAFDSEENIIIADAGKHCLQKYYQDGRIITLYTSKDMLPSSLFVDEYDNIYFADQNDHTVKKLTKAGVMTIVAGIQDKPGSQLNQLDTPYGIYVDRNNVLYISDTANQRIVKYLPNNQGIQIIANASDLNLPGCVFVDETGDGALYISDLYNHQVLKYAPGASKGIVVAGGRGFGKALNQLYQPHAVFVDSTTGSLFVMDNGNYRFVKWSKGTEQGELLSGTTRIISGTGIRFDSQWNLYVVDQGAKRVLTFEFNSNSCKN
ncbi:unnamed protein product [Rotaria sp. Silwood1]|nr:unnamed protein product [Rotaria sp. Silwood1]